MAWWMWMVLGVVLLVGEMLTPGLILLFFGIAAFIVGLVVAIGAESPEWLQWLLFSVLSLGLMMALRNRLAKWRGPSTGKSDLDGFIGAVAVPQGEIAPGQIGRVEMRGTTWTAKNVGPATIVPGQRCKVEKVEGLTVSVRAE